LLKSCPDMRGAEAEAWADVEAFERLHERNAQPIIGITIFRIRIARKLVFG
jgi:hypothetical protein